MGGGASKSNNYTMITDHKLTTAHYQQVESKTPTKLSKGSSVSAIAITPGGGVPLNQKGQEATPPRLKKGQSASVLTSSLSPNQHNNSNIQLKKGSSEKVLSLSERRKSQSPALKKAQTEAQLFPSFPKGGKVTVSARLPWLVKDTNISSGEQ